MFLPLTVTTFVWNVLRGSLSLVFFTCFFGASSSLSPLSVVGYFFEGVAFIFPPPPPPPSRFPPQTPQI